MYLTATCRNPFSYRVEKFVNLLCVNQKYHKIYRKIYFWLWNYPENHSTHSSNFSTKCFSLLNTISLKFQYDHAYISAPGSTRLPRHSTCNGALWTVTGIPLQYICYEGYPRQWWVVRSLGPAVAGALITFLYAPGSPDLVRSTVFCKGMSLLSRLPHK